MIHSKRKEKKNVSVILTSLHSSAFSVIHLLFFSYKPYIVLCGIWTWAYKSLVMLVSWEVEHNVLTHNTLFVIFNFECAILVILWNVDLIRLVQSIIQWLFCFLMTKHVCFRPNSISNNSNNWKHVFELRSIVKTHHPRGTAWLL